MSTARELRVSFCTTCMGRRHHIEQLYLGNVERALSYENVEFVLLDYGSRDGLADWAKSELADLRERGIVRYFRAEEPTVFHMAHAKNAAHRLASGDVLVNLDADNWFESGFAEELSALFARGVRTVARFQGCPRGSAGRLALRRADFLALGGYDEDLRGWGFEDRDLLLRAVRSGLVPKLLNARHARAIDHSNDERMRHMPGGRGWHRENRARSLANLVARRYVANSGRDWGALRLTESGSG